MTTPTSNTSNNKLSPQDFQVIRTLGEGSYSVVLEVQTIQPPIIHYAMKVVDKAFIERYQKQNVVLNEKRALLACNHPSIVRLYHTFRDDESLYFILELAQNGDIAEDIKRCGTYQLPRARYYIGALFNALYYLHFTVGVVHRDVKPENLLLDASSHLKLADFGSCKFIHDVEKVRDKRGNFVGTASFVPPELLNGQSIEGDIGIGADWWAAGCVLYQMMTGQPAYRGTSEYLIFQSILRDDPVFPSDFDPSAKDLITRLMNRDSQQRLGVKESDWPIIKSHPFFAGLDLDTLCTTDPPAQECQPIVYPANPATNEENETTAVISDLPSGSLEQETTQVETVQETNQVETVPEITSANTPRSSLCERITSRFKMSASKKG